MSALRLASILVVGLVQVCFAADVKQMSASHKPFFTSQMIELATGGYRPSAITVPSPLPENNTYSETGFFYLTNSYNSDCAYPVIDYGVPVDHCIIDYGFAYKFQLTQDSCVGGIIEYYRDEYCTIKAGTSDLEPQSNNCSLSANPLLETGMPMYAQLMCTTDATPKVPVTSGVTETFTNSTDCDTDGEYEYMAYATDQCIIINGTAFTVSCDGNAVTWNIDILDGVADCQGQLYPYPLPDECSLTQGFTGDDDGDIYNPSFINPPPSVSTTPFPTSFAMAGNDSEITFCVQGSGPSAEPTAAPTLVPTMRPSMKPTTTHMPTAKPSTAYPTAAKANTVSFQATQVISGISLDTYNSDPTLYSNTLKETIAASMVGVLPENIINLVVVSAPSSAVEQVTAGVASGVASLLKAASVRTSLRSSLRTVFSTSAISISYTVQVTTQLTEADLVGQLESSVDSGVFTEMLQTNAANDGATGLEDASSASITVTTDNGGGGSSGLSDGAIAGIVIGVIAGVAIIGGIIYYFFVMPKKTLLNSPNVEL